MGIGGRVDGGDQGQNLLRDPGFELAGAHWRTLDDGSSFVTESVRSGGKALKLINDFTGNRAERAHNVVQGNGAGIEAGREYEYTVWVRGQGVVGIGMGGKPLAVLRWKNSEGRTIRREHYMWAPYGTYGYRSMSIVTEAPAGAVAVDVGFRSWWDCTGGYTVWDDIVLKVKQADSRGGLVGSYQAEQAHSFGGGGVASAQPGYTGTGYIHFDRAPGHLEWTNVNAGAGGNRLLVFRFAWEANAKPWNLLVNGTSAGSKTPAPTGSPSGWATLIWPVAMNAGNNTVRAVVPQPGFGLSVDRLDVHEP